MLRIDQWSDIPDAWLRGEQAALIAFQRRLYVSGVMMWQTNTTEFHCIK
jgi:hypothetical protein